jgi:hypothetical protein
MHAFSDTFILIYPFCVSIQTVEANGTSLVMLNCHVLLFRLFLFCLSHFTSCSCVKTIWCWGNQICHAVCYISFTLTLCCLCFLHDCISLVSLSHLTVLDSRTYYIALGKERPPLWSDGQISWLQIQRFWVRFPALQDFLRSSGSGTGSTQPREYN